MWPISTAAQTALYQSHGVDARVTVYSPAAGVLQLPIADGEVVADASSQVRRTGTLQADPRYWPRSPQDLLAPYGSYAQVEYGIVLASGETEWVPVMLGYLDDAQRSRPISGSGEVTVKLVDRAARVAEDRFDTPKQTLSGATAVSEIRRLIQDSLGSDVSVVDRTGSVQVAAQIVIERNRWQDGVEKLADAIGAEVFFDQRGQGVIRPQPTLADPVAWIVRSGAEGIVLSQDERLTRELVYNRVVASGQRSDGTPPVYAAVSDTDPASPTLYGGPFGRKPRFYSSELLTTVGQCTTAATALLAKVRGLYGQLEMTTIVNPALEPGDVIAREDPTTGTRTVHILDKVPIPLSPKGTQALAVRSQELPAEQ